MNFFLALVYLLKLNEKYKGWVALDQIRIISKQRILSLDGSISGIEIMEIKKVLQEIFVD